MKDAEIFTQECIQARAEFCAALDKIEWNNELRTKAETLLILFDQFEDVKEQQIKELKEALEGIERSCDGNNPDHAQIWFICKQALNSK